LIDLDAGGVRQASGPYVKPTKAGGGFSSSSMSNLACSPPPAGWLLHHNQGSTFRSNFAEI
jgi:hypothetical protein